MAALPVPNCLMLSTASDKELLFTILRLNILVPRGRPRFGQHQESRPLESDPTPEVHDARTSLPSVHAQSQV